MAITIYQELDSVNIIDGFNNYITASSNNINTYSDFKFKVEVIELDSDLSTVISNTTLYQLPNPEGFLVINPSEYFNLEDNLSTSSLLNSKQDTNVYKRGYVKVTEYYNGSDQSSTSVNSKSFLLINGEENYDLDTSFDYIEYINNNEDSKLLTDSTLVRNITENSSNMISMLNGGNWGSNLSDNPIDGISYNAYNDRLQYDIFYNNGRDDIGYGSNYTGIRFYIDNGFVLNNAVNQIDINNSYNLLNLATKNYTELYINGSWINYSGQTTTDLLNSDLKYFDFRIESGIRIDGTLRDGIVDYWTFNDFETTLSGTFTTYGELNSEGIDVVFMDTDIQTNLPASNYSFNSFVGDWSYIAITRGLKRSFTTEKSISVWYLKTGIDTSLNGNILRLNSSDYIKSDANDLYFNGTNIGGTQTLGDTWNHLVVQQSGTSVEVFLNGDYLHTEPSTTIDRFATGNNASILDGTFYFFDYTALWDRPLTLSEITELYNSGNGSFYPGWIIQSGYTTGSIDYRYKLTEKCFNNFEEYNIIWTNRLGGQENFLFRGILEKSNKSNKNTYKKSNFNINNQGELDRTFLDKRSYVSSKNVETKYKLSTDYIKNEYRDLIFDMINSTNVYLEKDGVLTPISILTDNFRISNKTNEGLVNFVIEFEKNIYKKFKRK